jgi:hypothetical protein
MIDLFLRLIDKLTELVKYKSELRKKQFDLLISPLYQDLKEIHENYLRMFETCKIELQKGTDPLIVYKKISLDRLEKEALRRSIFEKAVILKDKKHLKPYHLFFEKICHYFEYSIDVNPQIYSSCPESFISNSARLLKILDSIINGRVSKSALFKNRSMQNVNEHILEFIDLTLKKIRKNWSAITKSYTEILSLISLS